MSFTAGILQKRSDASISRASSLDAGGFAYDFDFFADRALASDAHAGHVPRPLRAISVRIDRA
jgi:hypothetical protein